MDGRVAAEFQPPPLVFLVEFLEYFTDILSERNKMPRQVIINLVLFRIHDGYLQVLFFLGAAGKSLPFIVPLEDESLDQAATRWLTSLLGRQDSHLQQLYTYSDVDQPIRVVYLAIAPSETVPAIGRDYTWQPVKAKTDLPVTEAAIFNHAMHQLRHKVSSEFLVYSFLPPEFPLSEVQKAYELILGEVQDKRNFRRQLLASGTISPTPRMTSGVGRPARLYRFHARRKDPGFPS